VNEKAESGVGARSRSAPWACETRAAWQTRKSEAAPALSKGFRASRALLWRAHALL
jgi:hypothetical protein